MTTLRVLFDAPPAPERAVPWALYDDAGRLIRSGLDLPSKWPAAERREAVIAASQVRLVAADLPPLAPGSLLSAAAFALEDRVAGPAEAQHLAVSPQAANGRTRVAVVARSLVASLADGRAEFRCDRLIAEPELASPIAGWRWCAEDGRAFVRASDGSAFAIDASRPGGTLPPELALALARAVRNPDSPLAVQVDGAEVADVDLAQWQRDTGVAFVRGTPWHWARATPASFTDAIDLRQGPFATAAPQNRGALLKLLRPAALVATLALALHVGATVGEWTWLKVDAWRQSARWSELAAAAGIAPEQAGSPVAARSAVARRYADLRHGRGLAAPGDALPLAARAATALGGLPPGALRNAVYADGHWTIELAGVNADALRRFESQMRAAGVPTLTATTAAGARVRFGDL